MTLVFSGRGNRNQTRVVRHMWWYMVIRDYFRLPLFKHVWNERVPQVAIIWRLLYGTESPKNAIKSLFGFCANILFAFLSRLMQELKMKNHVSFLVDSCHMQKTWLGHPSKWNPMNR